MDERRASVEYAVTFAINTIKRLDDLFGKGSSVGGCALVLIHKSSEEWEDCEKIGEYNEPGQFGHKASDDYYLYGWDRVVAKTIRPKLVSDSETYVEIYTGDFCISGLMSLEAIEASSLITSKGGDA